MKAEDKIYNDLTFFTNEPGAAILDRFKKTLKDVQFFDILVGYFRTSGFFRLYNSFETIEKIRVLVGINVDKMTFEANGVDNMREEFDSHFITLKEIESGNYNVLLVNRIS